MTPLKSLLFAAAATAALGTSTAWADITIATAGPMTGQYASFGAQMRAGAEMAVKNINEQGGVLGEKLVLEIGDDACDPKQAVAVANQLVNRDVKLVAGHFCSGSSIPASKVYEEEGLIQISPASTNPQLTEESGDSVFRTCGRDDQQGQVAGEFLATEFGDKKIAIIHDKTAYGKGLADETKKVLNAAGIQEAMYEAYTAGERDYSALVTKLKREGVDALYVGGYHTEAGLILRQLREQGMQTQLISGDALVTQEFWSITGAAGNGTLMTFSPDPRKNEAAAPIVQQFRDAGIEPEGYVLYTYGTIQAWAQAVDKAGSTDTDDVIEALRSNEFDTVLGKIGFDEKGDVTAPGYVFYQWKDGSYDYYEGGKS